MLTFKCDGVEYKGFAPFNFTDAMKHQIAVVRVEDSQEMWFVENLEALKQYYQEHNPWVLPCDVSILEPHQMDQFVWTREMVRKYLPAVSIKVGAMIHGAKVTGRKNPEATVTVENTGTLHSGNQPWRDWHFSWDAIVESLNNRRPLNGND